MVRRWVCVWVGVVCAGVWVVCAAGCPARPQGGSAGTGNGGAASAPPAVPERPVPEAPPAAPAAPALPTGAVALPTGDLGTSLVLARYVPEGDGAVRAGEEFAYRIEVTNLSDELLLEDVAVWEDGEGRWEVVESEPPAEERAGQRVWRVGALRPRERGVVRVTAVADEAGRAEARIRVTYAPALLAAVEVVEPGLRVVKEAPGEWSACDLVPVRYIVTNTDDEPTAPLTVVDNLPEGLAAPDGTRQLTVRMPSLAPGETREESTLLRPTGYGEMSSRAVATTEDGVTASSRRTTTVLRQGVLSMTADGPDLQFSDAAVRYIFTVFNSGNGAATDVRVQVRLDAETEILGPPGADVGEGVAVLPVGEIPAGGSRRVSLTVTRPTAGRIAAAAEAIAPCMRAAEGQRAAAGVETLIRGVMDLELAVRDEVDPVRLGGEAVYEITVHNTGSAPDTNIVLMATMPEELTPLDAFGQTDAEIQGRTVRFAPLDWLGPGERGVWYVRGLADRPGDIRFLVELTSDGLRRPVHFVEATRLY